MIKQIICIVIISELLLTGLGLCGHSHEHVACIDKQFSHKTLSFETTAEDQDREQDQDHPSEKDHSKSNFHCPCFGSFIGIPSPFVFRTPVTSQWFSPCEMQLYTFFWYPRIYRPPTELA